MAPNPFQKQYLMTAGPTPVPPAVSQAMASPMLYHRAPAFVEVYERVLAKLPEVFQTANDVLAFTASGSGAMESAVANLVRPGDRVVFATLSETSTGIVHDVQAIAEVVRRHGALLAVDAVSGLGAAELRQDAWGVDVVVAGSQKALMCPPGLAFASVSQKALDFVAERRGGSYYFDWTKTAKAQRKGDSPFTPAVP